MLTCTSLSIAEVCIPDLVDTRLKFEGYRAKQRKSKDKNPFAESKRDVATLIHTIAHSTDVKVTYHHYTCFAFPC